MLGTNDLLKSSLMLLLFLGPCTLVRAQEERETGPGVESELGEEAEEKERRHIFSVLLSHDHVSQGIRDGERTWLSLPSFMLAYNYELNDRFTIGIAGDIIVEQFAVEGSGREEGELIERSYPIALLATGTYRVVNHLGVLLGGGFEYAKEETFGLVRLGLEPYLKVNPRLELLLNLSYDIKIDAYDNWNLGFGVAFKL